MSKNRDIGFSDSQPKDSWNNGTSAAGQTPERLPPSYDSITQPGYQYGLSQPMPGTFVSDSQSSASFFKTMPPYPTESPVSLSQTTSGTHMPVPQPTSGTHIQMPQPTSGTHIPMPQPTSGTHIPMPQPTSGTHILMPQPTSGTHIPMPQPTFGTHIPMPQPTSGTHIPMPQPTSGTYIPMPQSELQNDRPVPQSPYNSAYQSTTYNPTIGQQVHTHPGSSNVIYVPVVRSTSNQSRNCGVIIATIIFLKIVIISIIFSRI